VRERRRFHRVARHERQLAAVDARQDVDELIEVHRLFEAVTHGLIHQRVIRNLAIAGNVLEARGRIGKDGSHEVVGEHPLKLRRDFLAAAVARDGERDRRVPPPARLEHRRIEKRLDEDVLHRRGMQVAEDV